MADNTTPSVPSGSLGTREAAAYLRIGVSTLREYRSPGWAKHTRPGPTYYKIGGRYRYDVVDLDSWVEARRVESDAVMMNTIVLTRSGEKRFGDCVAGDFDFDPETDLPETARSRDGVQ